MAKKPKKYLSAKVELKVTASQLRGPVDKSKVRSRGPAHIGQLKSQEVIHLGNIEQGELTKRLSMATQILITGKVPAGAKKKESGRADTTQKETTKSEPGTKAPEKPKVQAKPKADTGANKPEVPGKKGSEAPAAKKK
jgi:hypothetical protein